MKKFDVEITETLQRTVSVEADSRAEAERLVTEAWNNEDYVLDSTDFVGVDFKTVGEQELSENRKISKKPNQPTHVLIDKNPAFSRPSVVLLEQIFTIDKERINNFMGLTSEWEMKQIEEALLKSLGINK